MTTDAAHWDYADARALAIRLLLLKKFKLVDMKPSLRSKAVRRPQKYTSGHFIAPVQLTYALDNWYYIHIGATPSTFVTTVAC